ALEDAAEILSHDERAKNWLLIADRMRDAFTSQFWDEKDDYLASALTYRDGVLKPLDVPNITAGWCLNTSLWKKLPKGEHEEKVSAIVNRLFSDEFLTDVGIRTRSKYVEEPLGKKVVDYHGSQTVWPMFTFKVIEGLQRQHMYELAEQLTRRLINGVNSAEGFQEFLIVDKDGRLKIPTNSKRADVQQVQMLPEKRIAFTIVPLIMLAFRHNHPLERRPQLAWQRELEQTILSSIPLVDRYDPREAVGFLDPTHVRLSRKVGWLWSFGYLQEPKVR
ncbi:hypothetical protein B7Z17_04840, partial [Candidatus Saccharibacteria bacterium 32-49-10]